MAAAPLTPFSNSKNALVPTLFAGQVGERDTSHYLFFLPYSDCLYCCEMKNLDQECYYPKLGFSFYLMVKLFLVFFDVFGGIMAV